jgi:hypothetical protein
MEITCALTGKHFKSLRGFLNHLRPFKMTSKQYYDQYVKAENEDICECGNYRKYGNWKYSKYCSQKCIYNIENKLNSIRLRFEGIDRKEKLKIFKEKRGFVDTNIQKRNDTLQKKADLLGISLQEYFSLHSKKSYLNMSKDQIDARTIKVMDTKSKNNNFGGKSPYKEYLLYNNLISVQGYEPIILNYLQSILNPNELIAGGKSVDCIKYNFNNEIKMYFPDAKLFDLLIEVKSKFTFEKNKEAVFAKIGGVFDANKSILLVIPTIAEVRKNKLDGSKKLLDWAISSQASKDFRKESFVAIYDEGSTTILYGVESSDSKCRDSLRTLRECDIVWSSIKVEAASAEIDGANQSEHNDLN